jgi:hypothetical protein
MYASQMMHSHPHVKGSVNDALITSIEASYSCAQACTSCADACLGEPMVQQLTQCIRLNLDCADICAATGSVATRRSGSNDETIRNMLRTCADICVLCAEECRRHAAVHAHCRLCADACITCAQSCEQALDSMES